MTPVDFVVLGLAAVGLISVWKFYKASERARKAEIRAREAETDAHESMVLAQRYKGERDSYRKDLEALLASQRPVVAEAACEEPGVC